MRTILNKLLLGGSCLAVVLSLLGGVLGLTAAPVAAADYQGNIITDYNSSTDDDGQGIYLILNIILTVLTFGVATAGILGLVITGVMYMTSQGDTAKMATAKKRIAEIVLGLVAYALIYVVLNWLIPGGLTTIF